MAGTRTASQGVRPAIRSPDGRPVQPRGGRSPRRRSTVVERFDRVRAQGVLRRVHQEDCCQALAITPTRKHESDGGPRAVAVATLLARHSSNPEVDVARFLDAMMFNWLLGGTDAHAKNFAVLHGAPGNVRLAPLYAVISALPYPSLGGASGSLAMAIHGERAIDRLDGSDWHVPRLFLVLA
jgi:serine/threonine protein kinase HipA of HipAB toxin-antitoxin module